MFSDSKRKNLTSKKIIAILFSLGLMTISTPSISQTGNELLNDCRQGITFNGGLCLGLIVGYGNGYNNGRQAGAMFYHLGGRTDMVEIEKKQQELKKVEDLARYYCFPENVTQGQVRDVVVKYLEENPSIRHLDAPMLIVVALKQAFPCR